MLIALMSSAPWVDALNISAAKLLDDLKWNQFALSFKPLVGIIYIQLQSNSGIRPIKGMECQ
jgi:hypothetical protein